MDVNKRMGMFRLASRELFNNYFHVKAHGEDAWVAEERFSNVEEELFRALVTEPERLPDIDYQECQPSIQVELKSGLSSAPWHLSRGPDSGAWDHPQTFCLPDARLKFICFFDWDKIGIKDYQYVRVEVESWPSKPELEKREALIEYQYVCFTKPA